MIGPNPQSTNYFQNKITIILLKLIKFFYYNLLKKNIYFIIL